MQEKVFTPDPIALRLLTQLREAGFETYFCGGCVRDFLMGRAPKDWDIATSAAPEEVEDLFEHTVPVGKAFGVMIVVAEGMNFEVATFRSDSAYVDGRRPEAVTFTSAEEDVQRRDFTINALLYDPVANRVIDHVGGRADIENKILRTVGDPAKRFREDHLRLLRAVRFAARTGFTLEEKTRAALREQAGLVRTVSGERVGEELRRMLSEGYARPAFALLEETGLLPQVLPEVAAMRGVPQPENFHPEGDVLTHTLLMLGLMDRDVNAGGSETLPAADAFQREVLGFALLLHDVAKPETISFSDRIRFNEHDKRGAATAVHMLDRLKRPRRVTDAVAALIRRHMHFRDLAHMRAAKRRRFLQDEFFPLHLELHRYDCQGSHGILDTYRFGLAAWREEMARAPAPEPLLTGKDLLAQGFSPGPRLGEILRAVDDARLEEKIATKAAALRFVKERYG